MEKVYICGHKNPDTDSVASAAAYAYLKSQIDIRFDYEPVRCGNLSDQTKFVFEQAGVQVPSFMKDIYPKVSDSMSKDVITVQENDPVSLILKHIQQHGIRFTPVLDNDKNYKGMAGVTELTELFIRDDRAAKPVFTLRSDTLRRSLKATILNVGQENEFDASIIVATMPYELFNEHVSQTCDETHTILITGNRQNILEDAFKRNYPAIVIVGLKESEFAKMDFQNFKGWVYASPFDSAQTIRCVEMATPVKKLMDTSIPTISPDDYIDKVSEVLSQTSAKSLPVVDNGKLCGIITSTDILKRKRGKLIMMDHNEMGQAIDGAESADILEIVDHHRLGTIKTVNPIYFYAKPVGSTCTLVYQMFKSNGVQIPYKFAMLLLGGVLSDTVITKSPTTTKEDHVAISELQDICGLDAKEYGIKIFSATDSLGSRSAQDIVGTDFKIYEEYGVRMGIGQVETVTLQEIGTVKPGIIEELNRLKSKNSLDWVMILVTDIIKEESLLVSTGFPADKLLTYKRLDNDTLYLPKVLSRKKQLLPEVLRVLEEFSQK